MTAKQIKSATSGDVAAVPFQLVSIDPTAAPNGGTGDDWLVYRISQGLNLVTGYRCGSRAHVVAEVERIVIALNERLLVRGRPFRSAGRPAKRHKDLV